MTSTYTLNQLLADIRKVFPEETQFSDDQIKRYSTWTITDICYNADIPELEASSSSLTLQTNTYKYSLSFIDYLYIRSITNDDENTRLYPISLTEWQLTDTDLTGPPVEYYIEGTDLYIRPTPSSTEAGGTLTIYYVANPTMWVDPTDTSPLPPYFDEAIYQGTLFRLYRSNDEPERAQAAFAIYRGILNARRAIRAKETRFSDAGVVPYVTYFSE